jgi:hypothetical protein
MGCFFPDETTRWRGRYLATGEEQGLTEGWLRGGGGNTVLEATRQLGEDLAGGSRVTMQTRPPSPCSSGGHRQAQDPLDRTEK